MARFIEYPLVIFAIISTAIAFLCILGERKKRAINIVAFFFNIGSAIWSFFFGIIFVQDSAHVAYIFRSIGMVGTFMYLITITILLIEWSGLKKPFQWVIFLISMLAVVIYPFNIRESATVFYQSPIGMSYEFVPDIWNNIYNIYVIVVSINYVIMAIAMTRHGQKRRKRTMGKRIILFVVIIFIGSIFDTILPSMGFAAIPGSTVAQFFGSLVVTSIVFYSEKTSVALTNLTEYVYHSVKIPILIYDDTRKLRLYNHSAKEVFGISSKDMDDFSVDKLFEVSEAILSPGINNLSVDAKCRCRNMFCSLDINMTYDNYGEIIGYIVIANDITEKINSINELKEARKLADEANSAKSDFLANMSHEIRTPINTVLGMNELVLRESTEKDIVSYAENIKSAGDSLLSLVNDILDFSKIEAGRLELVCESYKMMELLRNTASMFTGRIDEKGLHFHVEAEEDLPTALYGDGPRIKQVLVNLLSNAVKYTNEGDVWLKVRCEESDGFFGKIIFEVKDTGIGIKEVDRMKLFSSFIRLEEQRNRSIEGTGLGLGIVKRITELMGGIVEVDSVYGEGSTFRVIIPQEIINPEPMGKLVLETRPVAVGKYLPSFVTDGASLLVVDDNRMNIGVIQGLLKGMNLKIDTALSGIGAIELSNKNKYDLIFLDHMMPEMDGIETLKRIKSDDASLNKSTVVIALTANAISGAKKMYLEAGFDDYLAKPVESRNLERMLKIYLPPESIIDDHEAIQKQYNQMLENTEEASTVEASGTEESLKDKLAEHGISLDEALKYCGGVESYKLGAETFLEQIESQKGDLSRFFENQDWKNYRILIHGIKSNAKILGDMTLFEEAYRQEKICTVGERGIEPEELEEALSLVEHTIKALETCFPEFTGAETAGATVVEGEEVLPITADELRDKLTELAEYAANYEDSEFVDGVHDLQRYDLSTDMKSLLSEAERFMKLYKYSEAEETIKKGLVQ